MDHHNETTFVAPTGESLGIKNEKMNINTTMLTSFKRKQTEYHIAIMQVGSLPAGS